MPLDSTARSRLRQGLARARALLQEGDHPAAFVALCDGMSPDAEYVEQARAARFQIGLDPEQLALRRLRVALAGDSTLDHLAPVLRLWLAQAGMDAEMRIIPFGTTTQSILDTESDLHDFRPQVAWLLTGWRDLELRPAPGGDWEATRRAVAAAIARRRVLWDRLLARGDCLVLENTVAMPAEDPHGNLAGAAPWGLRAALRLYNAELAAALPRGVALLDLEHVAARHGLTRWEDARYWFHSRHAFALDATGPVAHAAARLLAGAQGLARKCLVLDLDNTLWGGVVADDGVEGIALGAGAAGEAFVAFQAHLRALRERGVILAACSKNQPEIAALPFREHPDCVLRMEDFAVFRAGWNNKADEVRSIAAALNIGLDALVFVDDNPMERDLVRRHLPQVAVVELPEDPALYVAALEAGRWFESLGLSREDAERTRLYAENARREEARAGAVDMAAYLRGLEMRAATGGADPFHLPRIAQLIAKSNQFHLTGSRPTETEIAACAADPDRAVLHLRLRDRFGDNGLVAALLLRQEGEALVIETWVMSCRVLGRGVEEFTLNAVLAEARRRGCPRLLGRYRASGRNGLVAGLYERLGFARAGEADGAVSWMLETPAHPGWPTTIGTEAA